MSLKRLLKWLGFFLGLIIGIFLLLLLVPEKETIAKLQPRGSTEYWEMSEGFRIAYTHLSGIDSINKTPVIFLHGGPGGYVHSSSIKTFASLAEIGHDVYLYDQRGSGLSDRMSKYSDINLNKHLSDLHEIIKQKIKAPKVILIGQSFGSIIISQYSAQHPETIDKIVFSSPGALRPHRQINGNYVDLDSIYLAPDSLLFKTPYYFVKDVDNMAMKPKAIAASVGALIFNKKFISDKQMDRMLNTLASQFTKGMVADPKNVLPEEGGGRLYAYMATNSDDFPEIRDKINSVTAPILVIQGQYEYHSYGVAYEYVDLYPNGKYRFIENAGHEIWWEQEVEYVKVIKDFLNE
ncbi:alpha/beta fold hydrolase [Portibacter lacus]|uniref:Proline iminopeptidase n=1 Tax=Portibacter lacus TaxID=1099794 RepID=A0AA37SUW9_9BACT|nr:alpha/beta hydrolase [Portibacter lacus]GLR19525.1 proline iminopeptidase [Portibacter lacus]